MVNKNKYALIKLYMINIFEIYNINNFYLFYLFLILYEYFINTLRTQQTFR